ncbi:uncharacterized protein [Typha latifolia]|uniref:uncharacterized protein n=1 Tax=Typha latifolia TaxID=4733 RepID=UPI003C2D9EC5
MENTTVVDSQSSIASGNVDQQSEDVVDSQSAIASANVNKQSEDVVDSQSAIASANVNKQSEDVIDSQSLIASANADQQSEDVAPPHSAHGDAEPKVDASPEEIRSIMEVIATAGKFWHDWDYLKGLLSFQLKQVLAEYPEAQAISEVVSQQSSLSGETYPELVKRLDEALLSFIEGPPFTLQRLCEILLSPKSTYSNLSKLALALEKNLLVTSTLTMSTDPYPTALGQRVDEGDKEREELHDHSNPVSNGVETTAADGDEEMTDAEADENVGNPDTEMQEEKANETSDQNADRVPKPAISTETTINVSENNASTSEVP